MKKKSALQRLRDLGFDRTTHVLFTRYYRVRCSQCEALVINGTPCHEDGCLNRPKETDVESE